MQRFDIENAALWASGKKTKVRGGRGMEGPFFLKIENIVQKKNNKPNNEGTLSVNKRTR